jgi:hypothetical protein
MQLSGLAAAKDYSGLGRMIGNPASTADVLTDLDWLKARLLKGDSAFIAMLYAKLLWSVAQRSPKEAPKEEADQLRQTAAMTLFYAVAAIAVDGTRCGDPSAPAHRRDQLMSLEPGIWSFFAALPPPHRQRILDLAVLLEQRTAARRDVQGDVEFLCRGGMEEMSYNLQHGTVREVPTPPGAIGRTMETTGDGNYRPSVQKEEAWRPRAREARARVAAILSALAVAMTGTPPAPRP